MRNLHHQKRVLIDFFFCFGLILITITAYVLTESDNFSVRMEQLLWMIRAIVPQVSIQLHRDLHTPTRAEIHLYDAFGKRR